MVMAPIWAGLNAGNSAAASGEAEYTEAPASLTIVYSNAGGSTPLRMRAASHCSVSRHAVPFPMAATPRLSSRAIAAVVRAAASRCAAPAPCG